MYKNNQSSFCSTFYANLKKKIQYLSDNSSLYGIGYVISLSPTPFFKRFFWFFMLSACCYGSASVLQASLNLYSTGSVSYTVETDYLDWDTPFPAVTLCEIFDENRVKALITRNNIPTTLSNFCKDISFWNSKYCKTCSTCKNQTCVNDFTYLVNSLRLNCSDVLSECWWNDKPFPCCDRFRPLLSEYGVCFTFNSRLTGSNSTYTVNRRVGLPALVFTALVGVSIRIHSPDDIVTVGADNVIAKCGSLPLITDYEITLKVEQTISDISVRSLSPENRDCYFKNERLHAKHYPFPTYSYNACVMYCRAMMQVDYCNCTYHFMPKLDKFPTCGIQGLACLNQNKEALYKTTCECPMDCEEIVYKPTYVYCVRHSGIKLTEELTQRGTRGRVKLGQLPSLRVRRHAIRDLLGLVVDIGSVVGVFFGASLLSFIEIIYIFFIRREH